jgi:hypothetical protein
VIVNRLMRGIKLALALTKHVSATAARREVLNGIAPGWNFYSDWGPNAALIEGECVDTTGPPLDTVTA